MVGLDAAPAVLPRTQELGRPRDPTGRHYDRSAGCQLDWDRSKAGNTGQDHVPGSADLGPVSERKRPMRAAMERRTVKVLRTDLTPQGVEKETRRRSALRPLRYGGGWKEATAPPRRKEQGRFRMPWRKAVEAG